MYDVKTSATNFNAALSMLRFMILRDRTDDFYNTIHKIYGDWIEYLEDYTDRGDDDFQNYDEYALDYFRDELEEFIKGKVDETEYTQEVMDKWDDMKYPD